MNGREAPQAGDMTGASVDGHSGAGAVVEVVTVPPVHTGEGVDAQPLVALGERGAAVCDGDVCYLPSA